MKNILSLLCLFCTYLFSQGQQIKLYGGGQMTISGGNSMAWSGLTLTPSSNFILGSSLGLSGSPGNTFPSNHVQRVYNFDPITSAFSGSIRIAYLDGELNGLDENNLQLYANNGSSWAGFPASIADPSMNYLQSDGISNLPLGGLLLSSASALPLTWGMASVSRDGAAVRIKWTTAQETDVSHFDIERSMDARNWRIAIAGIRARNSLQGANYEATDHPFYSGHLFYRIRQTDLNGSYSFSKILMAPGGNDERQLIITPNPARGSFFVSLPDIANLSALQLLSQSGQVLHSWKGGQYQYQLPPLPAGTYILVIRYRNGASGTEKLQVR